MKRGSTSLDALILISILLLIGSPVESFYTLIPGEIHSARDVGFYGSSYIATAAVLPIILLLAALINPQALLVENFGRRGSVRWKILITL